MRAHILSIGSELILGHLTDTNATFLAQELVGLGIDLVQVTQVGDDLPRLVAALRHASDADLVVCTGGVGPTDDDLTREAIAALVGQEPAVDADLLDGIRRYFAGRGLTMPEPNAKQAWLIPAAEALPNPVGTAPGWFVRHEGTTIVSMPGVPREMTRMWREQVVPRLAPSLPTRVIRSALFKTLGIGESAAAQLLDDLIKREQPVVATYAKDDGVQIRVTATAPTETEAAATLEATRGEVRRKLGDVIYAEDDTPLAVALADLLRARGVTLGIVEVGTGGRFGSLMLGEPATADVIGGAFAFAAGEDGSNAAERADDGRDCFDASLGLGCVASVVPTDLGLYEGRVAVAVTGGLTVETSFPIRAAFAEVQRRAALHAADVLRRALSPSP
jgi:nicotinamide-nucleotide amidase